MNFPYISLYFSRELFLVAVHGWFAIQTNVWKVQNTTGRFLSQLHPSNFVLKILFLVPKVSNSWNFSETMFYENYLTLDFRTNTVISSLFAYLSKWHRKPWHQTPIGFSFSEYACFTGRKINLLFIHRAKNITTHFFHMHRLSIFQIQELGCCLGTAPPPHPHTYLQS